MKTLLVILFFIPVLLLAKEGSLVDISDTSIKKNFFDIELNTQQTFFVSAWNYNGGAVYKSSSIQPESTYDVLYESKDNYLFSIKILDYDDARVDDDIILAGGYFSKCLCGVLLRHDNKSGQWQEIYFDDIDNPFVSNIFSISTNTVPGKIDFTRVFLACAEGVIYYSDKYAKSFKKADIQAGKNVVKEIAFANNKNGYAIVGPEQNLINQLFVTADSGISWQLLKDFSNEYISFNDIKIAGDTILLFGSKLTKGMILVSLDAGNTFEYAYIDNDKYFPHALVSSVRDGNNIYAIDENGTIFTNTTNYFDWDIVLESQSGEHFVDACLRNNLFLFCGYEGKIYKFNK